MQKPNLIKIAKIGTAHGIKGAVNITSYTEEKNALAKYKKITSKDASKEFKIKIIGHKKSHLICQIEGIIDRNMAETLNGIELFIDRDELPKIENEDEFYYSDLISLTVKDVNDKPYGTIKDIENYGAGDIITILKNDKTTELYSFTKEAFPKINVKEGFVTFNAPETEFIENDEE